jgi:tetratricopeptide (TPR) repeat protein
MIQKIEQFLKNNLSSQLRSKFKFFGLISVIVVVGICEMFIYWNSHVYNRAKKQKDVGEKIRILNTAIPFFPSNDLVYYEKGKAILDEALSDIHDERFDVSSLQKSIQSFKKSIKINPASQFSHFYLGQAFLYQSFLSSSPQLESSTFDALKKAAILAGNNSQIFYEVGKIFLSRWAQISDEDRTLTIDILKKVLSKKDKERLNILLHIWETNVNNYEVMRALLPEDAEIYRLYAQFLGERSLSLEERHKILAMAEYLDFENASYEHSLGENELFYSQIDQAMAHFQSCLKILERIKFYQSLSQQSQIDPSEFRRLLKSTYLNLAKTILGKGGSLKEADDSLRKFLDLEEKVAPLNNLESYLIYMDVIEEELEPDYEDLDKLSFHLLLYFKQNKYRDIVRLGNLLKQSFLVIPQSQKEKYVETMRIIGDAYQRVNQLYDASEFYVRALEADPDNLQTLLLIRQNYERLGDDVQASEIKITIEELISPSQTDLGTEIPLKRGQEYTQSIVLEGRDILLQLRFQNGWKDRPPLVYVEFNDHVVWEYFLDNEMVSILLNTKSGENLLRLKTIDRPITLTSLRYEFRIP